MQIARNISELMNINEKLHLDKGEVHIWKFSLLSDRPSKEEIEVILDKEELGRANKYHFEIDRDRFVVARWHLKNVLANYVMDRPGNICFGLNDFGKPALDDNYRDTGIKFNLSHSGDMILIAVSNDLETGIDIECIDLEVSCMELAESFFAPGEIKVLSEMPLKERTEAFYRCWTLKEAFAKATGMGLAIPLDRFELDIGSDGITTIKWPSKNMINPSIYSLKSPHIDDGYAAAVAIEGKDLLAVPMNWTTLS